MRKTILLLLIAGLNAQTSFPQANPDTLQHETPLLHGAHRQGKRTDIDMATWRGYGLGQFIHFGLYSMLGGDWKGAHYNGASEWIYSWNKVDKGEYDSLYRQFDPVSLKPAEWAAMARQMGVRYVIITTKHHDGFCLWPSKFTYFNISNTPYKKDLIGQLVKAYNDAGIDVYLYFSVMDWSNPDWRYDLKTAKDSADFDRFKLFTKNQLTELLERYPTTKGLWFDGTWDASWKKSGAFTDSLEQYLKQVHPGLIIGSRLRADDYGNRHFDANGHLMGDYQQGWERKYPATFTQTKGNDWDCVMTIPENGWGYARQWLGHWKTPYQLLEILANCTSLSGNLVINFGPKGDGAIRIEEIQLAQSIGDWMKVNKEAVYNVHYADWEKQDWGYYTESADKSRIYMIVFNIPISRQLKIAPKRGSTIMDAHLLSGGKKLDLKQIEQGVFYADLPEGQWKWPVVIILDKAAVQQKKTETNTHI